MTSTPDGACELRLEEMQSKTAPWRERHATLLSFLAIEKEKSSVFLRHEA